MSNQASLGDITGSKESSGSEAIRETTNEEEKEAGFVDIPEDWNVETVKEVADPEQEDSFTDGDWVESSDMDEQGNIQLVQLGHLGEGVFKGEPNRFVNEEFAEEEDCTILEEGELMISRMQEPILRACLLPEFEKESIMAVDIARLRPKEEWNKQFLKYLFNSRPVWKQGLAWASGTTRKRISRSNLGKVELQKPEKDEQRRIASVLYNVDQAISKTEGIIEQTQRVKKGLMQDLFTEGYYSHEEFEEHPLLGERPASWSVETVGDLTKKVQYGLSEALQEEGEYPIFRMNNYENGYMRDHPMKYIDLSEEEFQKYKVEKGDILFNRTNSHELVGKTGIFELEGDYVFASYLVRLRTNEKVDPYYLNFFMNSGEGQRRLKTFATKGVSQSNINASSVQKLKVPVPDKKEEQRKIVDVIKNLDQKVKWNKDYLEELKSLKKGLMQDLLTGSVRTGEDVRVLDEVVEVES